MPGNHILGTEIVEKGSPDREQEEDKEETQLSECTERLQRIFMTYCAVNTNSNTNKMPCFKFVTLLKDCGFIKGILKSGRLDYSNFL